MLRFEVMLAMRHLRHSPGQTALTLGTVAIAVTVMIFINSLILGLQRRILRDQIGALPHITIKMPEAEPARLQAVASPRPGVLYSTRVETQAPKRTDIEQPELLEAQVRRFPGVRVAVPAARGQAFVVRGARRYGVSVSGADPVRQEEIVSLSKDLVEGRWLTLGPDELVIGFKLAEDLGARLGDRVRLESSEGVKAVFRIAGIFDTGVNAVDSGQLFVTLRAAQNLFATGRNVSAMLLKLGDPFEADRVADRISESLGYKTESWMKEQAMIVNAFNAQNSSRQMISFFSLLASAFGIASVLIVSVLQKSKEIGILKSMGARDRQLLAVFTLEGLFISVLGALLGAGCGAWLLHLLSGIKQVARFGKSNQLFPVAFDPSVFLGAMLAAIVATLLASLLPALRAARMHPVDVIRGG